jgi:hypothetical protein
VALRVGQRPTAVLLYDYHALHRNWFTGDVDEEPTWTDWDYILAEVGQMLEDYRTPEGHMFWEAESERVTFNAQRKINKAKAAIDRKTKGSKNKPYSPQDGEYWTTEPVLMYGDDWPTIEEWMEEKIAREGPMVE